MRIELVTMWYNEEFLAPFFLNHYSWVDKIHIILDADTNDGTEAIIKQYPNVEVEHFRFPDMMDDILKVNKLNEKYRSLTNADYVILVDSDEFIFCNRPGKPVRDHLEETMKEAYFVNLWQVYQHEQDPPLDPEVPVFRQRRHGDPNMTDPFNILYVKPVVAKGRKDLSWTTGNHGLLYNGKDLLWKTRDISVLKALNISANRDEMLQGAHWRLVDLNETIKRRIRNRKHRQSRSNLAKGLTVQYHTVTEEEIVKEYHHHKNDPVVIADDGLPQWQTAEESAALPEQWTKHAPVFEYEAAFDDCAYPWAGHKWFAYDLVRNTRPKLLVELGTYKGTSLFSFCQAAKDAGLDARICAIDTWRGDKHAGYYDETVLQEVKRILRAYYATVNWTLFRETFDDALPRFADRSIDILHIDGLHTYEAVKHDYEAWRTKVKEDGVILLHDIVVREQDFGVFTLWEQLRGGGATLQFLHSNGLGVVFNGPPHAVLGQDPEALQTHYLRRYENKLLDSINRAMAPSASRQQAGRDAEAVLPAPIKEALPLRVGFLTAEAHSLACPHLRLQAPLSHLRDTGAVELIHLGEIAGSEFKLDTGDLKQPDVIVVQREFVALMPYAQLAQHLDRRRQKIVYDLDDALDELPDHHVAAEKYRAIGHLIRDYIRNADLVTVSTESLKQRYGRLSSNITVVQNALDTRLWGRVCRPAVSDGTVRILFSGTPTHGHDLSMIEDAIEQNIAEFGDGVAFYFWGNSSHRLSRRRQVKTLAAFTPDYARYAELLQSTPVDFALVPLENTVFNRAKSHIKWLEYSACRIPGIYSGVGEYRTSIQNGVTGVLVDNDPGAWREAIRRFVKDEAWRKKIGENAHDEVVRNHSVDRKAVQWLQAYRQPRLHAPKRRVSIIIPVFNKLEFTRKCLEAVARNTPAGLYELVLVDNGSVDGTGEFLRQLGGDAKIIVNDANLGFARACNQGAHAASTDYLLFLNNDAEPRERWIEPLLETVENDESVCAAGSKLLYPDETIQHGGIVIFDDRIAKDPLLARNNHAKKPSHAPEANVPAVCQALTAACLLLRRRDFEEAGGFDEGYWNGYEDVDLCFALGSRGRKLVYQPASVVVHHESQSGPERFSKAPANIARLHGKWLGKIRVDVVREPDGTVRETSAALRRYVAPGERGPSLTPASMRPGLVSLVLLTFNQKRYTRECVESIRMHTPEAHEIIFVDNGSTDGTVQWLRKFAGEHPNCRLIENAKNLGFARGCNQGIGAASGEYVLLLNNDVVVTENWLSGLLECLASDPAAGIVGPMTNNISGIQKDHAASYKTMEEMQAYAKAFRDRNRGRRAPLRRIVGFCMLFRRSLVERIGLLDEQFGTGNFEDDDFCLRASLEGCRNLVAADVFIHHYGSRSFAGNKIDYGSTLSGHRKIFNGKWSAIPRDSDAGRKLFLLSTLETAADLSAAGEADAAVRKLIEGIGRTPEAAALYEALARTLFDAGRHQDALDAVSSMPEQDRESMAMRLLAGCCREALGRHDEAETIAERVLAHDSSQDPTFPNASRLSPHDRASALNLKGVLFFKRGDRASAGEYFDRAAGADPSFGEPLTNLGVLRWSEGSREEGLGLLEKGFILSPEAADIASLYHRAICDLRACPRGEKVFRAAKELHPRNRRIAFLLIDLLLQQERYEAAMKEIEEAMGNFSVDDGFLAASLAVRERLGARAPLNRKKGSLSVSMIVRNEERNIAKCLQSVKPIADEIIVVDTGSTDRTRDIARALGAEVHDFAWTGDFGRARNYSLSKATGDWVLSLDADEVISRRDHAALRELVKKSKPSAYKIVTRNYSNEVGAQGFVANAGEYPDEEAGLGWFPSAKARLFPNRDDVRFENPVHEFVEGTAAKAGLATKPCGVPVHHYGRLNGERLREKGEAYYELGKKKLVEKGASDLKALFELGVQAGELHKYDEAAAFFERLVALDARYPLALFNLGFAYLELGRYAEAMECARKAYELDSSKKECAVNLAQCEIIAGDVEKAAVLLEETLKKFPDYPTAMIGLAAALAVMGRPEEGAKLIERLMARRFNCANALHEIATGLCRTERHREALSLFGLAAKTHNVHNETKTLVDRCYRALSEKECPQPLPT